MAPDTMRLSRTTTRSRFPRLHDLLRNAMDMKIICEIPRVIIAEREKLGTSTIMHAALFLDFERATTSDTMEDTN